MSYAEDRRAYRHDSTFTDFDDARTRAVIHNDGVDIEALDGPHPVRIATFTDADTALAFMPPTPEGQALAGLIIDAHAGYWDWVRHELS